MDKIYTPSQIWSNYDSKALPLEVSIIDIKTHISEKNKAIVKNLSFTSEITKENNKVRAYMKIYYKDQEETQKFPTILIFQDYVNEISENVILETVSMGYMVCVFDYKGVTDKNKLEHTIYPDDLSYCNFNIENKELYIANPSIFETCQYHWTLIARRAIELLKDEPLCDFNNIACLSILNGCDIAWPVLTFDENVKTGIFINNLGFKHETKISKPIIESNKTSHEAFQVGISSEAYVKLNKKPALCILGTNNSITKIEKMESDFDIINENKTLTMLIDTGDNSYVNSNVNKTILIWLEKFLNNKSVEIPSSPVLTYEKINENECILSSKIENIENIKDARVLISTIDTSFQTRNWYERKFDLQKGNVKLNLKQGYGTRYALLNLTYKNDIMVSSKPIKIITENKNNEIIKKTRILFDANVDKDIFRVKSLSLFSYNLGPVFEKGPNNVLGVGVKEDDVILLTYTLGDIKRSAEDNYSLRFYAYTQVDKEITIIVKVLIDSEIVKYSTKIKIFATGEWNSFIVDSSDLKDEFLKPLKSWAQVKALGFKNITGVLFSNIIWI